MEEERTAPSRPDIPGYRIVRLIGTGGMGSVYAAEKLATHEMFALKLMHEHLAADKAHAARFEREIRALRDIRHPNVVEVYDSGLPSVGGASRAYVTMELLEGETLQDMLKRESALPSSRAVSIMLQVLDGLAAAHRAGVLHRDIGPSNVFLVPKSDGKLRIKLLDFGLARQTLGEDASGAVTQPGTLMGRPAYAAPEMFLEKPVCEASDVFACGIMLFRMLAGRLPYKAATAQMLWVERFAERASPNEYPSVLEYQPTVPVELARVVTDAIRRDLEQRLPTAREFQKRLLAIEGEFSVDAPTSAAYRMAALKTEARPQPPHHSSTAGATTTSVRSMAAAMRRRRLMIGGGIAAGVVLVALLIVRVAGDSGKRGPTGQAHAGETVAAAPPPGIVAARDGAAMPASAPVSPDASPHDAGSIPEVATADAGIAVAAAEASLDAFAPDAAPETVRLTFTGLPPRSSAWAGRARVGGDGTVDVPRSSHPIAVRVEIPGGQYEPWRDRVVPDRPRTVRPSLRRVAVVSAPDDGGSQPPETGVARVDGGVFATHYP